MTNWEQPHWSGRPQETPVVRARLKPNLFARLARAAAHNAFMVIGLAMFVTVIGMVLAGSSIRLLPGSAPAISLDPQTAAAQSALDEFFPGIDRTFFATVENNSQTYARTSAVSVANELRRQQKLFKSAFVPGVGPFYEKYGLLYLDPEEVQRRVDVVLQMQPLFQALAAAPNLEGLAALVRQIANAVSQGQSPPLLEKVLRAAALTVEDQALGKQNPVDWVRLAGLRSEPAGTRWFIVAEPQPGQEAAAADAARVISSRIERVTWSFPPHTFDARPVPPTLDLVVPALLSILLVVIVVGAGLGSVRSSLAVLATVLVSLAASAGTAVLLRPTFDAVTWSLAAAVMAPAFLFSVTVAVAFSEARAAGRSPATSVMLAAHRAGPRLVALLILAEDLWLSWVARQIDSLSLLAVSVSVGTLVAALLSLTLVPAILAFGGPSEEPGRNHWLDEAVNHPAGRNWRNLRALLAIVVLGVALFCTIFLPSVKFGDPQLRGLQPGALDTPNAIGAVHFLTPSHAAGDLIRRIGAVTDVGAIRWIEQFMPVENEPKLVTLQRLSAIATAGDLPEQLPESALAPDLLSGIDASLKEIADGPGQEDLRAAALRLRRALEVWAAPQTPSAEQIAGLEGALFKGLADLSSEAQRLSTLAAPSIADLDPQLREHYVAADGRWRLEVLPKPGVTSLSFAAAMRKISPGVAGVPVVALARNEIMHHESILALAPAFAVTTLLVMGFVRRFDRAVVALAPVPLALSLASAFLVAGGELIDGPALAALTTAIALGSSAALILALGRLPRAGDPDDLPDPTIRSAMLPLVATLGATAPLALSGNAAIADFAYVPSLLLLAMLLCNLLIGTQLAFWLKNLFKRSSGE